MRSTSTGSLAPLALLAVALVGCDPELPPIQTTDTPTAMAATLLFMPELDYRAAFVGPSGDPATGPEPIPPQTRAQLFLFEPAGEGDPKFAVNAAVSVRAGAATATPLAPAEEGYLLSSYDDESFVYAPAAEYTFEAIHGDATHAAVVSSAPAAETVPQLHPGGEGYLMHPKGTDLTLTRSGAGQLAPAFVTVWAMDETGFSGESVFSNQPGSPDELLAFGADPSPWRAATVTIPGAALGAGDATFVIAVTAVALGEAVTTGLANTVALAGAADVGTLRTTP
jgi:hypothetical protein